MAIVVKELVDSRSGSEALEDLKIKVTYTRIFKVWDDAGGTTSLRLGPKVVIESVKAFAGVSIGSIYTTSTETDNRAILQNLDPQMSDGHTWNCTLTYASLFGEDPSTIEENPLLRPPKISSGTNSYSVTRRFDVNDKACINSAKDYFDPLPQINEPYGKFTVTRNFPQDNYFILIEHVNTVNDATYYAFDAGSLRIADFTQSGPKWENGYLFWEVSVTFEHRKKQANKKVAGTVKDVDGWNTLLLDAGYNEISGTKTTGVLDADSKDATVPRLLNGAGVALTSFGVTDVSYEEFQFNERKDFTALGVI